MLQDTELAQEIRLVAARVRYLASTLEGERGRLRDHRWDICTDIAGDLIELAQRISPISPTTVRKTKKRSEMRQVTTVQHINGRKVIVQSPRRSFAICVEGKQ